MISIVTIVAFTMLIMFIPCLIGTWFISLGLNAVVVSAIFLAILLPILYGIVRRTI